MAKDGSRSSPTPRRRQHAVNRRLSARQRQELADAYEAGQTTTDLMVGYQIGKGSVLAILRDAGVEMRGQGLPEADTSEAIRLYESGLSLVRVAERFGCDHESVRKALRAAGVTLRKPSERSS